MHVTNGIFFIIIIIYIEVKGHKQQFLYLVRVDPNFLSFPYNYGHKSEIISATFDRILVVTMRPHSAFVFS